MPRAAVVRDIRHQRVGDDVEGARQRSEEADEGDARADGHEEDGAVHGDKHNDLHTSVVMDCDAGLGVCNQTFIIFYPLVLWSTVYAAVIISESPTL